MFRKIVLCAAGLALSGCALQMHASADETPPAMLRIHLPEPLGQDGAMTLSLIESCKQDTPVSRVLFHAGQARKPGDLATDLPVAGGKAIVLHYASTLAGSPACSMYSRLSLEAGKRYAIYLGAMPAGVAGLSVDGPCSITVMGDTAGFLAIAPMQSACEK